MGDNKEKLIQNMTRITNNIDINKDWNWNPLKVKTQDNWSIECSSNAEKKKNRGSRLIKKWPFDLFSCVVRIEQ